MHIKVTAYSGKTRLIPSDSITLRKDGERYSYFVIMHNTNDNEISKKEYERIEKILDKLNRIECAQMNKDAEEKGLGKIWNDKEINGLTGIEL